MTEMHSRIMIGKSFELPVTQDNFAVRSRSFLIDV